MGMRSWFIYGSSNLLWRYSFVFCKNLALKYHIQEYLFIILKKLSFFFSITQNHSSYTLLFSLLCPFYFESLSFIFFFSFLPSFFLFPPVLLNICIRNHLSMSLYMLGRWNEWFLFIKAWLTGDKTVLSLTFYFLWSQPDCMELWNEELPSRSLTFLFLRDKEAMWILGESRRGV